MNAIPNAQEFLRFNPDDARKLFERLDHIHLVAIQPDAPKTTKPHGKYFGADIDGALAWAANVNGNGWGVYWTLNYVGQSVGTKPSKKDIQAARGAHCDLDPPKDGSAWDKGEVIGALTEHNVPPSLIIDSGNGVQPVWLLDSPARDWAEIEAANIGIRDNFGGDDCHNIDRLLRVPGSVNYPNRAKRERGRVPCLASWVQDDTGQRYQPSDLSAAFPAAKRQSDCGQSNDDQRVPTKTGALIAAIMRGDNWHNNVLRLTAHLVAKGRTTVELLAMADCLTLDGYTVEETRADMRGMIADARRKFGHAEPQDAQELGYVDADGVWHAYEGDGRAPDDVVREADLVPMLDLVALSRTPAVPKAFAIERIAPLGEVTMLYGPGSAGKSLLGQQLATVAAAGIPKCLGLDVMATAAVYLTCEDDADQLHFRQEHLCEALRVPMADLAGKLHLSSLRGALGNELATFGHDNKMTPTQAYHRLCCTVTHIGAKLVILDNVAHLFVGNENDRADVTRFVNLLNRLAGDTGAAIILLGHPNKAGDDWSGSTAWNNAVRSRLYLDHDEQTDIRTLTLPKANYSQKGEVARFIWQDWAFVHLDELTPERADKLRDTVQASADNLLFMACLAERTKQQRAVSEKRGPNFAPVVFAAMPESKSIGKIRLEQAMDRLFRIGKIERSELWKGPDRKAVFGLRETAGNGAANTMRATRETVSETAENRAGNAPTTHTIYKYIPGAALRADAPDIEGEAGACPRCDDTGCAWCETAKEPTP